MITFIKVTLVVVPAIAGGTLYYSKDISALEAIVGTIGISAALYILVFQPSAVIQAVFSIL